MDRRRGESGAGVHLPVPHIQPHRPLDGTPRTTVPQEQVGVPVTEGLRRQPVPPGDVARRCLGMPPGLRHPKPPSAASPVLHPHVDSHHPATAAFLAGCAQPKGQRVGLACLPFPAVPDGPLPLPPSVPRGGRVHEDREPMAVSGQPKGGPLTRFPDGRHRVLPPGPPPTGHGALPLQASGEEPAGQGLRIGHGGPSLARMQGGVVRVLHPGGEEALPLRGPGPQDAAPRRHPAPEGSCAPPHAPPAGLEAAMAPEQAAPDPRCDRHEPKQPSGPACPAPPADRRGPPVTLPDPTGQGPQHGVPTMGAVPHPPDPVDVPSGARCRRFKGAHAVAAFQPAEVIERA